MINPLSKKNKNQTKNKHFKTALTRAQNINFTKTDKFEISKNVWTQFQVIVLFEPFCDFLPFSFKTKRARLIWDHTELHCRSDSLFEF